MPRIFLFCLLLLLVAVRGNGQFIMAQATQRDTGKLYLRNVPSGLLDFLDGNINLGSEYRFSGTWSATLDAGGIFYSQYFEKNRRATGFLLRPGVRVYPGKSKDYFVELQLHYKQVMYHIRDWIDRDVVNGVATYEELKTFRYRKRVMGVHIMGGMKKYLGRSHRLFIEVYSGLGVHFKDQYLVNEPNARYDPPFTLSTTDNTANNTAGNTSGNAPREKTVVPAVPGGIRLTYRLR
jgi:hypothetical protein